MKKIIVLIILCLMTSLSFAEDIDGLSMKEVIMEFDGVEYKYQVGEFIPPIEIKYFEDGGIHNDTQMGALLSLYTQMKNKNWDGFRTVWKDYDQIKEEWESEYDQKYPSKEKYFESWDKVLAVPHHLQYCVVYKGYRIYVVEFTPVNEETLRSYNPIKEEGLLYYQFNKETMADKFVQNLSSPRFDPMTGVLSE